MSFLLHGLSGHETMPMNRLFEKRPVNKAEQVYAYSGIKNRHIDSSEESTQKHHRHRDKLEQSYQSIEHELDRDSAVLAADIMVSPVVVLSATSMVSEAVELFHKKKFRHVPVVSEEKGLIGMLSDRDILRYLADKSSKKEGEVHSPFSEVTNVITSEVVSASSDTDVRYIARLFVEGRIGAMPIVDNGNLIGILTRSDILRAVMQNFHIGLWA